MLLNVKPYKKDKCTVHWGLVIRTPYNQVDLVIRTGLSPYNQALADLIIRTDKKAQVRIIRSMKIFMSILE